MKAKALNAEPVAPAHRLWPVSKIQDQLYLIPLVTYLPYVPGAFNIGLMLKRMFKVWRIVYGNAGRDPLIRLEQPPDLMSQLKVKFTRRINKTAQAERLPGRSHTGKNQKLFTSLLRKTFQATSKS